MSKELQALEEIRYYGCGDVYYKDIFDKDFNIIENALKRLEEIDNYLYLNNKNFKALEIIKTNRVNVGWLLEVGNVETYNFAFPKTDRHLTQEEFDLLKEVLL